MEQARYWMWAKHKNIHLQASKNSSSASYDDSWEEQAFAEDAAGTLGGCIWPPRSYSCSFCRREFRSAQALGGHMNVHRRDRARLKQCSLPQNENFHQEHQNHHNNIQNPCVATGSQFSSHAPFSLVNPKSNSDLALLHQSVLPSKFSASAVQENYPTKQFTMESFRSQIPSSSFWSNLVSERKNNCIITHDLTSEEDKSSETADIRAKDGCVKTELSVGLNLSACKSQSSAMPDNKEEAVGCKRRRTDDDLFSPFITISTSTDHRNPVQAEVLKLCPSSTEDLDLELRLGDRPKVK